MDIRTISSHNFIPVIDPLFIKQNPDEFLAENGGFLSEVAIIGKSTSGFVHYRSATAPTNKDTNEFFSAFSSIADSIGIKVHAVINGLADSFLGKNPGYSTAKHGGNPNEDFICPSRDAYSVYLKSIVNEIMNFPIKGILLNNLRYAHEDYCFCERCSRTFSQSSDIDRIFSLSDLQRDNNLYERWINWRRNKLGEILADVSSVLAGRTDIPLNVTMDIDPTSQGAQGALLHFGQDIRIINQYSNPTIHLSAWTPYPNALNTPEYQTLLSNLDFIKAFQNQTQKDINLFLWGVESESLFEIVDALKQEISFKNVYVQNHFPTDYRKRRETHLGLG
ncbi:MAG: hypothetical protein ACTSXA_03250 [Candidatus Heimdallarchaeota archaeon]